MRKRFDMPAWIKEVEIKKPTMNFLAHSLENYGARVMSDENSRDVAALHYRAKFLFPGTVVTVGIILMDYQTDSDVVIETMTTLPKYMARMGFGSRAVTLFLQWAADNRLKEVRATQVKGEDNENFWRKNGFVQQEAPNPCNDFMYRIPEKPEKFE